uniref:Biotin carboxyl carrier protein of acetyl-CoA carboxylase n=1 Tax=Caulacanthus okamurae TaxID=152008 RepID=A0A6H1U711_9FLOR|nr:acetyl-CoA carboxylase biotin carboxyl carrier protein [Caulacanthus okamurae]QIZ74672.1 acetyl-CoA carboxylase biotin carboxyl carrier protein [Caulacanthus okamurae]
MKFTIKDLKTLLQSIQIHKINEIHIENSTFSLTINTLNQITDLKTIRHKKHIEYTPSNNQEIKNTISDSYFTIVSPMVGTFYCSPAPNEPPFIKLYDNVQKQQTVCIIEAMKLMNEIESEVSGEIVEILVKDGDIIDCGQALMRVKPMKNK